MMIRTYAGIIDDWHEELRNYRMNNLQEAHRASENGVRYTVYEWKYSSRVLMLDINETARVFYRIDFPEWLEHACYFFGWIVYIAVSVLVFKIAHRNPHAMIGAAGGIAFVSFNLLCMMASGHPDIFPVIIEKIMEYIADKMYWRYSDNKFKEFNFQIIHDKSRCEYFAWTLIDVHGGNNQLRTALKKVNEITGKLGLEFKVQT